MVTEAKTTNYWISNSALYIQLNATGEPNRIQASVVSGASILCYMQGIDGLGYDAGHNYQRWTLAAYPSEFPSDEKRYLYVAIPRPKKTDSSDGTIRQRNTDDVALVVFPSERIDIYGKSITDESKQVGSEDYYYIYLQGIISEVQITGDNVRYRDWVNAQPFDYGSLATDESLASGGISQWWQYNSINDTITFLKTIAIATISSLTATTIKITKELFFGDHKISGVAKDNTSDTSDELIVTPNFLGQFGVRHFLSKTDDDTSHGLITFEKGIRFGVQKVADALNEVWDITEAGIAHLSQLLVKGNVQIGEINKPVEANFGKYLAGSTGAQVAVKADGTSLAEFDYITIRRAADFRSITIHELRYIGGELAITPAAMQVSKVERLGKDGNVVADDVEPDKFKCYFDASDSKGEKKVYNEFMVGDQARCQQFGIGAGTHEFVKTKYYWRLVVEVGDDYIVLSNTDKDKLTTSEPSVNDNIVQLGYRYEGQDNRQAAIILSATANDAPSQKFYQGINDYSLDHVVKDEGYDAVTGLFHCNIYGDSYTGDKEGTSFFQYDSKKKEATFKGKMIFNSESKLPDGSSVNDIAKKDDLKDLNIKSGNLLRNTSFCGDYESIDISEDTEISEDKETFSEKLKYWTMENTRVVDTEDSTSGKAVQIGGTLSQRLAQPLLPGKDYVLSFKGKGTTVRVSVGGETQDVDMTSSFERYELHITCSDAENCVFSMDSTNCVVCEIMLSYGTIAPAWSPSYSDNDKSMAEFQNIKFLTDAITQGSTTIDGGLVMSQQFKVGNFRDKKMIKETGGMSGYYNDDDSPFLWGGGTLEQAIYTIQKYKDNPNYAPTAEELNNLAKFVVTHGGRAILTDIILRGIIYAEGGVMKSIKSPNGNFEIDEEGNLKAKDVTSVGGSFKNVSISGNIYTPYTVINRKNAGQYGSYSFDSVSFLYNLDLSLSGFSVQFEFVNKSDDGGITINYDVVVNLPEEDKYLGAEVNLFCAYNMIRLDNASYVKSYTDKQNILFEKKNLFVHQGQTVNLKCIKVDNVIRWIVNGVNDLFYSLSTAPKIIAMYQVRYDAEFGIYRDYCPTAFTYDISGGFSDIEHVATGVHDLSYKEDFDMIEPFAFDGMVGYSIDTENKKVRIFTYDRAGRTNDVPFGYRVYSGISRIESYIKEQN